MLQSAMDMVANAASDSLQVFFICNVIILVVLVSSLKTGADDDPDQPRNLCFQPVYDSAPGDPPGREVSIFVKQESCKVIVDEKLRLAKAPQVPNGPMEVPEAGTVCADENSLSCLEARGAEEIQSCEDGDLLRIEGASCLDICSQNNSSEMDDHVEEDEQFRKRVEAFISKVNNGLRDEMMQTTKQFAISQKCSLIESTSS